MIGDIIEIERAKHSMGALRNPDLEAGDGALPAIRSPASPRRDPDAVSLPALIVRWFHHCRAEVPLLARRVLAAL